MRTRPLLQPLGLGTKVPSRVNQPSVVRGETACSRASRHDRAVGLSNACAPFSTSPRQFARTAPKIKRTFVRVPRKAVKSNALRTAHASAAPASPAQSQQPPIPFSGQLLVTPRKSVNPTSVQLTTPGCPLEPHARAPAQSGPTQRAQERYARRNIPRPSPRCPHSRSYARACPRLRSPFPPKRLELRNSNVRERCRRRDWDHGCARGPGDLEGRREREGECANAPPQATAVP